VKAEQSNLPASVQARLKNLARSTDRPYDELLRYYGNERFLYRLSRSEYAERFVLKGALLLYARGLQGGRPTRDIDLRGYLSNDLPEVLKSVREICLTPVEPDGIRFDVDTIRGEMTQEQTGHPGVVVRFPGLLGRSRIPMQLDVNFFDEIVPASEQILYPTLLDFPSPRLRGYPLEALIAEKLHAIVVLGEINSRMKDYYDLWVLAKTHELDGVSVSRSIQATFSRRTTSLPEIPLAFFQSGWAQSRQDLWHALIKRLPDSHEVPSDLSLAVELIEQFLYPPLRAATDPGSFKKRWFPNGPWRDLK